MIYEKKDVNHLILNLKNLNNIRIFLLFGNIGTGKTTFVSKYLDNFNVTSPTFSICHEYSENISHYDLYRIECSQASLENIGFLNDILYKTVFVEWSEKLEKEFIKYLEQYYQNQLCKLYFDVNEITIFLQ